MSVAATRFGHTEGRVCLAYNDKNKKIATVGSDGEMRVWTGIDDDDCENTLIGDEVLSMTASTSKILTGVSGTNVLSGYTWEGESEGVVGPRFAADVTALSCSTSGETVVAGLADFSVKVINTSSFATVSLEGHSAPILSTDINRKGDVVASSSCDGSVRLWAVSNKSQILCLENVHSKSNDVPQSGTVAGIRFNREGQCLAVPRGQKVQVLDQSKNWGQASECIISSIEAEIVTCVDWSSDGSYLVAATNKGNLCLVKFPEMQLVKTIPSGRKQNICAVVCHPESNEAIFADIGGHWGLLEEIEVGGASSSDVGGLGVNKEDQEDMEALFNDDDDDDENSFSVAKVAAQAGYVKDADGNLTFTGDGQLPGEEERPSSALSGDSNIEPVIRERPQIVVPKVRLQPPFQPGASPQGLTNRFLVYNNVGIVKSHESDAERSLDIEFHDIAVHHALHLANHDQFSLAALSSSVLALASAGDGESGSKLSVNYFSSSDLNKEWSVTLTDNEVITGVAAGQSWVAVATDKYHLRLFTAGGMQMEVMMMPGPLVTMVGEGDSLLLIYHSGHPLPGHQSLCYTFYTINSHQVIPAHTSPLPLPLSPESELYWAGFSDTRAPVISDTHGWTRALDMDTWIWHPIINTRGHVRGKSDFYYVISVSHIESVLRCVLCKGSKHPPTVPRPLPVALPLEAPLVGLQSEKGGLEQTRVNLHLQSKFLQNSRVAENEDAADCLETVRRKEIETIMKLFALACKSDHESRAMEVAKLLPSVETLQLAIQYAAKMRRSALAEKLGKLAMQRQEEETVTGDDDTEKVVDEDDESQDMFEATQENPLLAAAAKRNNQEVKQTGLNITSQGRHESRNPFAKKVSGSLVAGSPSQSGIVFDSLKVANPSPSGAKEMTGFGQRKIVLSNQEKSKKSGVKQQTIKEKENRGENCESTDKLKGFQLFLAENKNSFQDEAGALMQWKSMDKITKDSYQEARIPVIGDNKRKREASDGDVDEGKKMKSSNTKQKLSNFAFSSN